MIKVMWFLRKSPHMTISDFRHWWINEHVQDIADDQKPHLKRYTVDLRIEDDKELLGAPDTEFPWDGIAEQWFETVEDYNSVYSRTDRSTRGDTLANTSAFARMVVEEHIIIP